MNDFNQQDLRQLAEKLSALGSEMIELESSLLVDQKSLHESHRRSAQNLAHYLALRRHDIRQIQSQLAALGLSSLGRTEGHVMDTVQTVLKVLRNLEGLDGGVPVSKERAIEIAEGTQITREQHGRVARSQSRGPESPNHGDDVVRCGGGLSPRARSSFERHELHADQLRA